MKYWSWTTGQSVQLMRMSRTITMQSFMLSAITATEKYFSSSLEQLKLATFILEIHSTLMCTHDLCFEQKQEKIPSENFNLHTCKKNLYITWTCFHYIVERR